MCLLGIDPLSTQYSQLSLSFLFVLFYFIEVGFHYVTVAGIDLKILLPQLLECCDCRYILFF